MYLSEGDNPNTYGQISPYCSIIHVCKLFAVNQIHVVISLELCISPQTYLFMVTELLPTILAT